MSSISKKSPIKRAAGYAKNGARAKSTAPFTSFDLSIYIHIPFCTHACPYCNFNFRLIQRYDQQFLKSYVQALRTEWLSALNEWPETPQIKTVYLGGGTPSLLPVDLLQEILESLVGDANDLEITLEANPAELGGNNRQYLAGLSALGFNRLSLGVQSMNPKILKALGRQHTPGEVSDAIHQAREAGFKNISLDLMIGAPEESLEDIEEDVSRLTAFNPEHISVYALTIEEKTRFHALAQKKQLALPDEELQVKMFARVQSLLKSAGYEQYEISNYARKNFESRHNTGYWMFRNYLGLGAGAHSFMHRKGVTRRFMNENDPQSYVNEIQKTSRAHVFEEELRGRKAMGEFVFTGLRLLAGFPLRRFKDTFACELEEVFSSEISRAKEEGYLETTVQNHEPSLRLTPRGVLFSDTVFEYFV